MRSLKPVFVEFIPEALADGELYVSIAYATAVHRCCCGCGIDVVTPLSPTDWQLIFDGVSVSLDPSIGNWSFPCRSHYWIRRNRVLWSEAWSDERVALSRAADRAAKDEQFSRARPEGEAAPEPKGTKPPMEPVKVSDRGPGAPPKPTDPGPVEPPASTKAVEPAGEPAPPKPSERSVWTRLSSLFSRSAVS